MCLMVPYILVNHGDVISSWSMIEKNFPLPYDPHPSVPFWYMILILVILLYHTLLTKKPALSGSSFLCRETNPCLRVILEAIAEDRHWWSDTTGSSTPNWITSWAPHHGRYHGEVKLFCMFFSLQGEPCSFLHHDMIIYIYIYNSSVIKTIIASAY